MIATRLEKTCPKCGSHLMIKEGDKGDFLACPKFPACRYTESIRNEDKLELRKPHNPYCDKCNHTGLLPFVKNGKVIPYAWINCECKQPEVEHYQEIKPEDFDFPCSSLFRGYYHETYGGYDPAQGIDNPPELEVSLPQPVIIKNVSLSEYNQLKGTVQYLKQKLQTLSVSKKKNVTKYD